MAGHFVNFEQYVWSNTDQFISNLDQNMIEDVSEVELYVIFINFRQVWMLELKYQRVHGEYTVIVLTWWDE